MTLKGDPVIDHGHFVWTKFPKTERPNVPSDERHIALCLRRFRHPTQGHALIAVFTTTRDRGDRPKAKGEIEINAAQARELGQSSAFHIDAKRIAVMPLTLDYFPDLDEATCGIRGRSERLAKAALLRFREIAAETPELIDYLGPEELRKGIFGR